MKSDNEFRRGLIDGIPIGLAYVAVSFAFGISGASHGIPVWALTLISATCVTSAGQFAAINTMTAGGSLVELVLSQIIINLRYSIMSIAIGQKMSEKSTLWNRLSMAFMVTDEIFAVSCAGRKEITPKYFLLALTILCVVLMVTSLFFDGMMSSVRNVTNTFIVPMQKGVNTVGTWVESKVEAFHNYESVVTENEQLKEKISSYETKLAQYQQDSYELDRLQKLYELDALYTDYEKTGARVISKDTGNWFDVFYIDKGTKDGLSVGCNVLYGNGLCGIITEIGESYAKVRTIIDDTSNVNAMILPSRSICNVSGSLTNYADGYMIAENIDKDAEISEGDQVVTSYVSNKYLSGINIGYVSKVESDSNNLTKTAYIIPAADFSNIEEVLVILQTKKNITD